MRKPHRSSLRLLALCTVLVFAVVIAGCAGTTESPKTSEAASTTVTSGSAETSMMPGADADPDAQLCAQCAGKGPAPVVVGAATYEDGVQVIRVKVEDGYYTPTQTTVKEAIPIAVMFSGNVAGCIGMPEFKELGKRGNFVNTGEATIELGPLAAGTYEYTCGMGRPGGTIVVE